MKLKNYNILPSNNQIIKNTEFLQIKNLLLKERNFFFLLNKMKLKGGIKIPTTKKLISKLKKISPGAQLLHKIFAGRVVYSIAPRREKSGFFKGMKFVKESIIPIKNKPFQEKIAAEILRPTVTLSLKKTYDQLLAEARLNYRKKYSPRKSKKKIFYKKKKKKKSIQTFISSPILGNFSFNWLFNRALRKKNIRLQRALRKSAYQHRRFKRWIWSLPKLWKKNASQDSQHLPKVSSEDRKKYFQNYSFNREHFELFYQAILKKGTLFLKKNFPGLIVPKKLYEEPWRKHSIQRKSFNKMISKIRNPRSVIRQSNLLEINKHKKKKINKVRKAFFKNVVPFLRKTAGSKIKINNKIIQSKNGNKTFLKNVVVPFLRKTAGSKVPFLRKTAGSKIKINNKIIQSKNENRFTKSYSTKK